MIIINHNDANKDKRKGYLYLEVIFGFYKSFKRVTKHLGFHIMFKMADLHDFIYTSVADDVNVTINDWYLYIPNFFPSV